MKISECEIGAFLSNYPDAIVTACSTMHDDAVTFIKPIPTICNAEIMCSHNTWRDVKNITESIRHKLNYI